MWQIAVGGLITIVTAVIVEYLRTPSLEFSIENPPLDVIFRENRPAREGRHLRLKLLNKPLPSWLQWLQRAAALQCRGLITFHHLDDGHDVFDRAMVVRWAGTPEPLPIQAFSSDGVQIQIFDPMRITTESRIDIYPAESELLDVAARFDNDEDCYGWNNEAYFSNPLWKNPSWRLMRGRYLVRVEVSSSGRKCVGFFRMINDGVRSDFRLRPATSEEIQRIDRTV
jgi:hypothetical protein